ncbi:hypothetical protein F511_24223 [Dorcoceras hygrometricum]|uniref:Uncharacterized protein n=1 Tax=Dorcoceras hygrometricum TaxID=472368 RepID=A0A2Z7ASS0_9LAMI|nr:hypothetical protein F511_24223 [Dorcoceras hygrometricum]
MFSKSHILRAGVQSWLRVFAAEDCWIGSVQSASLLSVVILLLILFFSVNVEFSSIHDLHNLGHVARNVSTDMPLLILFFFFFTGWALWAFSMKEYRKEMTLKVMRALPKEWNVKTLIMRESEDLNKLELHDLIAALKAYEFKMENRLEGDPSTSQPTKAFAATKKKPQKTAEQLSNDAMSLFVKNSGNLCENSCKFSLDL